MKKLILIAFVFFAFVVQAQEPPLSNRKDLTHIKDSLIVLGTFPSNTGQIDSFGYTTPLFPSLATDGGYVTVQQIKNKWNNREFKNDLINGNLFYKPDSKPTYAILRNRKGISIFYTVSIYEWNFAEMTRDQKIYWWYEYGLDNTVPNETWWTHPPIDTLVNWDIYHPVIIDTTVIDTFL